jgi:hypothetical protein
MYACIFTGNQQKIILNNENLRCHCFHIPHDISRRECISLDIPGYARILILILGYPGGPLSRCSHVAWPSDVSEVVQNEGKTMRAYNYISGLYAL